MKTLSLLNKPFQFNGKNLFYGNSAKRSNKTNLPDIAKNMLYEMKPDTMVEIPYKVIATSADDLNDGGNNEKNDKWVQSNGVTINLMAGAGILVSIQFLEDKKENKGTLFFFGTIDGPGLSAGISKDYSKIFGITMNQLGGIRHI